MLKKVFTKGKELPLHGTVHFRLDRKLLRDFDCFVLAHLVIAQYRGQVVIPDFGFYGRDYLTYLLPDDRLIAGVNFLAELKSDDPHRPVMQQALLLEEKEGHRCTNEDAQILADYEGLRRNAHDYGIRVQELMRLTPQTSRDTSRLSGWGGSLCG